MKRVLILSYTDNPSEGHALSCYKAIKEKGFDAYFVSLLSEFTSDTFPFFINGHRKWYLPYIWFKLKCKLYKNGYLSLTSQKHERCFFNLGNYYVGNANCILRKIPVVPDIIILGWCDFFISPKVLYDLYQLTKAKIIIPMVDAHVLGGGCHYPCECLQYTSGCNSCQALSSPIPARRLYVEKMIFLKDIPFEIVGTSYDLGRAKNVPFLKNKKMLQIIGVPDVPFIKSKIKARKEFGIGEDDFVIMFGASSLEEKRKGGRYFLDALNFFTQSINNRKVILLLLGTGSVNIEMLIGITVMPLGYLSLDKLFTAFYAADVFVSTSIDDSGPYMVNYSIACGTPVISFPVGVAMDLVKHGETGFLTNYLDAKEVGKYISLFYEMKEETYQLFTKKCMELMKEIQFTQKPWYFQVLED